MPKNTITRDQEKFIRDIVKTNREIINSLVTVKT
jgi:hypothetical protein